MTRKNTPAVSKRDPSARAITPRQQRLINVLIASASEGKSLSKQELGEAAGFGKGETARTETYRTLKRPAVRAALLAGIAEAAQIDAPGAYAVLRHVADNARSTRDRVTSARTILEMAGAVGGQAPAGLGIQVNVHLADPNAMARFNHLIALSDQHAAQAARPPGVLLEQGDHA